MHSQFKIFFNLFIFCVFISSCLTKKQAASKTQNAGTFLNGTSINTATGDVLIDNGTIWKDDAGNEILAQGGSIIMGKGLNSNVYNWFGIEYSDTPPLYGFIAVNHYTSKDLKNWHKEKPAFDNQTFKEFPAGKWAGRPAVLWNPNTKLYIMVIERNNPNGKRNAYVFLTANSLAGPWTYHLEKDLYTLPDGDGVQQTMGGLGAFADGNTAYLCYTFDIQPDGSAKPFTNKKQGIIKLAPDFMTPLSPVSGSYIEFDNTHTQTQEANRIFKRGNTYYHFASRTLGWKSSTTQYRTANEITGKWVGNNREGSWSARAQVATTPISATTFDTQNSYIIPIQGTETTTYMYIGDRWSRYINGADQSTGRYAFFPISFDDKGVPTINASGYESNGGDWLVNAASGKWRPLNLKP